MKFIQERLGHRSMQITYDIYSHVSKKMDKKNTAPWTVFLSDILIFWGEGIYPNHFHHSPQTQMLLYQT
ncbi:hypothetical protein [Siminovitchia terrae]